MYVIQDKGESAEASFSFYAGREANGEPLWSTVRGAEKFGNIVFAWLVWVKLRVYQIRKGRKHWKLVIVAT